MLTIFDIKKNQAIVQLRFHSKIIRLEMNHLHLYAASKDLIFVFSLKDLSLITRINVPQHLLRISMSSLGQIWDSHKESTSGKEPFSVIAYSGLFTNGSVHFH